VEICKAPRVQVRNSGDVQITRVPTCDFTVEVKDFVAYIRNQYHVFNVTHADWLD